MPKIGLPVVVTPTRVELGLRCYRRHALADILQRARYYSPSLEFGSVVHAGAAEWWRSSSLDNARAAVNAEWTKRFTANPEVSQESVSREMAIAMIEHYASHASMRGPFELEPGDWQFVTIEDLLEVPMAGGFKLSFQTDRVVYNKTNAHLVIIDTKTGARLDKRWERQWDTSLQMKLYKAGAAKAYDFEVDQVDVVVEGILKDVPSKIVYVPCPDWSAGLLHEAVHQAIYIAEHDEWLITGAEREAMIPRDMALIEEDALITTPLNYMSCFEYGVECPFRRLCTAEPEERVAILHAEYFEIKEEDSAY